MKPLNHLIALTCVALFLAACGESASDEPLPEGTAPSDPPTDREIEPAVQPEPEVDEPATVPEAEPEASTPPPLPVPVPEGEAERRTAPGISYVLPQGWTVGPERQMRLLTLLPPDAEGADLAISKWPGDVGGFAMNVQRWARQIGLPPIPNLMTAEASDYEKFKIDATTSTWIPLMNEDSGLAILAVWVPRGEDSDNPVETWTFKLTCKADQIQKLAPAVRAFCESVKFE